MFSLHPYKIFIYSHYCFLKQVIFYVMPQSSDSCNLNTRKHHFTAENVCPNPPRGPSCCETAGLRARISRGLSLAVEGQTTVVYMDDYDEENCCLLSMGRGLPCDRKDRLLLCDVKKQSAVLLVQGQRQWYNIN